jgi:hypothetical protein
MPTSACLIKFSLIFIVYITFYRLLSLMVPISTVAARGGQGAIAPGRQREGRQREGRQKRVVPAKEVTNMTFAPGRQKPWRRHCISELADMTIFYRNVTHLFIEHHLYSQDSFESLQEFNLQVLFVALPTTRNHPNRPK